jgi:hypothetical protein
MEHSPLRDHIKEIADDNFIFQIIADKDPLVQVNGLWLIKNYSYNCDKGTRIYLIAIISEIIKDPEFSPDEFKKIDQVTNCFRNLTYGKSEEALLIVEKMGLENITNFLEEVIANANSSEYSKVQVNLPLISEVVYTLVNLTAINCKIRNYITSRNEILEFIMGIMRKNGGELLLSVLWLLINLLWNDDNIKQRKEFLKQFVDKESIMRLMETCEDGEIREKTKIIYIALFDGNKDL